MRIAAVIAAVLTVSVPAARADTLESRYRVDGSDSGGATYAGEVVITAADGHYRVEGMINGESGSGIALMAGDAVAVLDASGTLTLFRAGTDGALSGRWVLRNPDGTVSTGEETWRRVRER